MRRQLVKIRVLSALFRLFLVYALARLSLLLIQQILEISQFLYDLRSDMILIISLFLFVVLSLTRQLYNNFESVQITAGISSSCSVCTICRRVKFKAIALLNLPTILYSLLASTLLVTRLHLVKFQCTILPQILKLCPQPIQFSVPNTIRNSSYKLRSLLLANNLFVKIKSFVQSSQRGINVSPQSQFQICHVIRTLRALISSSVSSTVCAAVERLKTASS